VILGLDNKNVCCPQPGFSCPNRRVSDFAVFLFQQKTPSRKEEGNFLGGWDDFRTLKWLDLVKAPELLMKQVQSLLSLA